MPRKQEIKKFSHISCLIWLYLALKSLRMNASAAAVPASVYCRSDTNTSSSTFQSDRRDCRCFLNLLTSRYMKVYHIFIFFCQISRNAAPKSTLTPRTIEFSLLTSTVCQGTREPRGILPFAAKDTGIPPLSLPQKATACQLKITELLFSRF